MKGALSGQGIVIASHTYCSRVFVIGSQQIARACAKQGANVVYISTPISWGHFFSLDEEVRQRVRIWRQGGRVVVAGLFEIIPFAWIPWSFAKWISRFSGVNVYLRSCVNLRRNVRTAAPQGWCVLINDEPRFCDLDKWLGASRSIYRATDLYAEMRKDGSLNHFERMCAERADKVIATSEAISEHLAQLQPRLTVAVVPNGVNVDLFRSLCPRPPDIRAEDTKWLLYVGALDERLDWEAVRVAASIAPLYLIGAGKPGYQALARKLVGDRYLGPKEHADVPAYICNCAAGFIPLRQDGVNDARSPMKLYEYFASGVPVIGTATRTLESESQLGLYLFRDTPQLVAEILDVLNKSEPIKHAHQLRTSANRRDWTLITSEVLRDKSAANTTSE
jgi:teichuronic acid biosynthesis glycosyltransferase TuaH